MKFFTKSLTAILVLTIALLGCKSQTKPNTKEFVFSQVGWKIEVPDGFTIMDSAQIEAMNNKGAEAIGKTYDTTIDMGATKTLISITKGRLNNFASTITPFDPKKDGSWEEANSALKKVVFETFQNQASSVKIDTSSGTEKIGSLEFEKFHLVTKYPNKIVLYTFMYNRLHKGFDHGISISYTDEKVGKELLAILATSKFSN